jgi:hypothetical protein
MTAAFLIFLDMDDGSDKPAAPGKGDAKVISLADLKKR